MTDAVGDPSGFSGRWATPLTGQMGMLTQAGDRVTATTTVSADESVLAGHFPNFPIFPGVCLLECAHQTVWAAIGDAPSAAADTTGLVAIERARFQQPVFPGDSLRVDAQLTAADGASRARVTVTAADDSGNTVATFRLAYRSGEAATSPAVDIKALLPHRYPMLLVDRVTDVAAGESLRALKAITLNEPCYAGIDDDADQAYPPSLMVESWCQAAGILACLQHPNPDVIKGRVTLFGSITDLELPGRAYPGDVMHHTVRLARQVSDAAVLEGETTVEGRTVQRVGGITIALRPAEVLGRAAGPQLR